MRRRWGSTSGRPRRVLCEHGTAARIIAELPGEVWTVGVFVDETPATVNGIARDLGLRAVQLHGDESPFDCAASAVPVIKTVAARGPWMP